MALSSQILAGSVSKSAPATPARMPPLLIFRDKKRVRHEDASAAEAQDALNAYYTKNGVYPKKFPDGIFTPSLPPLVIYRNGKHITHKDATAAEGQDAMNAYHRQHGRYPPKLEDGVFRVSLPSLIIYRDGKRIAYKEATTAEGQQAVDAYYAVNGKYPKRFSDGIFKPGQWVAHHESLLATLSDGDENSDGDDESDGGESGGINNNYQNNGDENAATPAPVASPALIMPDMETNLPPIPDIQKSYYQLEQERLHGGQRPSYFPRWEWNKPIPTSFPYATYDSSSSEEDSDGEEERARGAKTRELNKAENTANGLWTARGPMHYHKKALRQYYKARYPNIPLEHIDAKIEKEYTLTTHEEERCWKLAADNRELVKAHNQEVLRLRTRPADERND